MAEYGVMEGPLLLGDIFVGQVALSEGGDALLSETW